jgi:hypothetical protein
MLWYLLDLIWGCSVVPFLLKLRLRLIRIFEISVTLVGVVGDNGSTAFKLSPYLFIVLMTRSKVKDFS